MRITVQKNAGTTFSCTEKSSTGLKIKKHDSLYESLIKKYGEPETNAFGIKTFEFTPECYQFVIDAETGKPIQRKDSQYMGADGGRHFYLRKGRKLSRLKEYIPSWQS